jgi:hypothetical protein
MILHKWLIVAQFYHVKWRIEMTAEMGVETAAFEIEAFLDGWIGDMQPMRDWFHLFYQELSSMDGVTLTFVARPGVSYSIRPVHKMQIERDKFAIVDVIDDDPNERWLSVCFYDDMITDPHERGELIPGGLAGKDGYCFDLCENDKELALYLVDRLKEAGAAAAIG